MIFKTLIVQQHKINACEFQDERCSRLGLKVKLTNLSFVETDPSDYWDKIETRFSRPWKQGDLRELPSLFPNRHFPPFRLTSFSGLVFIFLVVHFPNCDGYQPPRPNCTERTRYYLLSDAEREAEDKASGAADEWEVRQKVAAAVAGVGS